MASSVRNVTVTADPIGLYWVMPDERSRAVPLPGDRIIFERADGRYDVREVSASGEHHGLRKGLSFDTARDFARRHLETSHRLWIGDHAHPDRFGPFSRHPTASRRAAVS